jgi:hypothetical protein
MSANGISELATKRARQEAKLAQAETDRAARNAVELGRYADVTADLTQLPTLYNPTGNDVNGDDPLVDNPNTGGLKVGRPWAT